MICAEKNNTIIGLAVAIIAFVVYANSLGNGFVWDDDVVIVANSALSGKAISLFRMTDTARATEPTAYYRPLTVLTFLIEERLHGLTPFLVRLVNILLHTANTYLVFRLARVLIKKQSAAILAGLLFAVHPLHSEAVDLNSARNTLLATFFIISSYLVHESITRKNNLTGAFSGSALFLAGLFSKEPALVVLPFICFLEMQHSRSTREFEKLRALLRLTPYIFSTIFYFVLRHKALAGAGVQLEVLPGLAGRLLENVYIIPRYMLTVLWPTALSPMYFLPADFHPIALQLALAWLCLFSLLIWFFTRGRSFATLFGLAWVILFWLPVSGIVPISSAHFADRYLYVPAIGLWLIVSDQIFRFTPSGNVVRRYCGIVVALILAVLAGFTVKRNLDWKSDITLFTQFVEQYPEHAYGHHNLGCAYLDKVKNIDLAERSFEKALAIDPAFPRLRTQMGYVRLQRGDYEGALRQYEEALKVNPLDAEAHLNSGIALEKLLRYEEALVEYRRFLDTPGNELEGARRSIQLKILALPQLLDSAGSGGNAR